MLFMVGFLLLALQMFYPWFTSSPTDRQKGIEKMKEIERVEQDEKQKAKLDSIQALRDTTKPMEMVDPPPMDQLSADTTNRE